MKLRRFAPTLLASTLLLAVLGQGFAYTLEDALENARGRPTVVAAEQALTVARADLARTQADPFALRLDKTQAQQTFSLSQVQARQAYYTALSEIGSAYATQLQAVLEQRAALASEALARRQASVARIRLARGSATEVEVREAQAALEVASAQREASDRALTFARNTLGALLPTGQDIGQLEPIADPAVLHPLPPIETILGATAKTSDLLGLQQAITLARVSASLLDPSYSSAREIQAADTALQTATATYLETTRTVFAEVRTLYGETSAAQKLFQAQSASADAAQSRMQLQRQRFARGLISDLELKQAEYDTMSVTLEATRAKTTFITSLLQLQATSALPLWPLRDVPVPTSQQPSGDASDESSAP